MAITINNGERICLRIESNRLHFQANHDFLTTICASIYGSRTESYMKIISQRVSTKITFILSILMLAGLIAVIILLPFVLNNVLNYFNKPLNHYNLILVLIYLVFVPAFAACISLLILLRRIMNEEIFTLRSISLLRIISWCCFAEIPLFCALSYFYFTAIILTIGCGFLGMILRVIKNVIENATRIKEENDLTV